MANDLFIKLKDGESIQGVFLGPRLEYHQHWVDNKSVKCTADDIQASQDCPHCVKDVRRTYKFKSNFAVWGKTFEIKIADFGWMVKKQLNELEKDGVYDLSKTLVKLSRSGEKLETKYSVFPVPETPNAKGEGGYDKANLIKVLEGAVLKDLDYKKPPPLLDDEGKYVPGKTTTVNSDPGAF